MINTVDIDTLPASREFDAYLHYEVLKHARPTDGIAGFYDLFNEVPAYTTDWRAMGMLIDGLWHPVLELSVYWGCWHFRYTDLDKGIFESKADTAPLAVARAVRKSRTAKYDDRHREHTD